MNGVNDLGVDCVRSSPNYNFKNCFDDAEFNDNIYNNVEHSCEYYEVGEFLSVFSHNIRKFATFSLNIRSLLGNWIDFRDLMTSVNKNEF